MKIVNLEVSLKNKHEGSITITYEDGHTVTTEHSIEDESVSQREFLLVAITNALNYEASEVINLPVFWDWG